MHRRSYLPQSVNVMSTLNRAKRAALAKATKSAKTRAREAAEDAHNATARAAAISAAQPRSSVFQRIARVLNTPIKITLPRVFRSR